jgi:hypothetical protein
MTLDTKTTEPKTQSKVATREMVQYPQGLIEFQQKIWGNYNKRFYEKKSEEDK